jgi:hypothetical protein
LEGEWEEGNGKIKKGRGTGRGERRKGIRGIGRGVSEERVKVDRRNGNREEGVRRDGTMEGERKKERKGKGKEE